LRVDFDRHLKLEFHGSTVTSDVGHHPLLGAVAEGPQRRQAEHGGAPLAAGDPDDRRGSFLTLSGPAHTLLRMSSG
jgi:hypothetical protein